MGTKKRRTRRTRKRRRRSCNQKPYIKQLCQSSKDVSLRLHSVLHSETLYQAAMSDVERCQYAVVLLQPCINTHTHTHVERCQFFGCISCYIQKPFVKQRCQTSKDVSLRLHCYNPISSGYVRRQNMLLCVCIAGCLICPDCDERNLHCGRL